MGQSVGLCLAAVLYLAALVLIWGGLGRAARGRWRLARLLLVPLAFGCHFPVMKFGLRLGESSWWQCDLCGRVEHRDACAGILLRRTPYSAPCAREVLDAYAAWTEPLVGDHEHDWAPTASSWRWPGIACTMLEPCHGWFERLPGTGDQSLARRAWQVFIAADPGQRHRWKREAARPDSKEDFERWLAETFP